MSTSAISIRGLRKRFELGVRAPDVSLREALVGGASRLRRAVAGRRAPAPPPVIWALDGIDLEVPHGEVLGIIGGNGAGKSTLLKILSGITDPTEGYAELRGRIASMLEVGTGFHGDLSGRENVYLNGALLGMGRREIDRKFDEIVAFSEVETFLDTPVKRYSSGMYMRLAFAVAAHLEPDVLIVDEVLAVGDMAFQRKCLGRMNAIAGEGRTVLFVSHNMTAVQGLCTRVALLEHGRLVFDGSPRDAVSRYLAAGVSTEMVPLADRTDRTGDGTTILTSVQIESLDTDGVIRSTSQLKITIEYRGDRPLSFPRFIATFRDVNDTGLFALDSWAAGGLPDDLPATGVVQCVTAPINLAPGRCYVNLRLRRGSVDVDRVRPAAVIDVESADFFGTGREPERDYAVMLVGHRWSPTA